MSWETDIAALPQPFKAPDVVRVLREHKVTRLDATSYHRLALGSGDPEALSDAVDAEGIEVGQEPTAIR